MLKAFRDYGWLLLLLVVGAGVVLITIFYNSKGRFKLSELKDILKQEHKVIDQTAKVRKDLAEKEHAQVVNEIKERYKEVMENLDSEEEKKIHDLEKDPEALVERLLRISS